MITFRATGHRLRDGVARRDVLYVGGTGLFGLTLTNWLNQRTAEAKAIEPSFGKAKSCIVLFLMGGPPQHSTWDPKPDAPAEVRGDIGLIETNVSGVRVGALMARLARQADKLCILRAVSTGDNAHSSSGYYMMTGQPHAPQNRENANPGPPNDWPNIGAVVQHLTKTGREVPAAIRLPMHIFNTDGSVWPGQDAGFLGRNCDPWLLRCEPASAGFKIDEFTLPIDVPIERLEGRAMLLGQLNQALATVEEDVRMEHFSQLARRAFGVLTSARSRAAFQLDNEPHSVRERYGRTQFGQSTLLARRLIEAGVRLVQVNWYRGPDEPKENPCWDSHVDETNRLKQVLIPPWDLAFSALIEDLSQRGMLDETLVVCMAEFGRTPRFNSRAGRDHWGPVFSVALAGGGVRGGMVHGASDKLGAYPQLGLVRPEDLLATIYHCLGISPVTEFFDALGRRFSLTRGEAIHALVS